MRNFLSLLLVFALAMPAFAQMDDDDLIIGSGKEKKHAFFLGPKIGLGLTSVSDPSEGKLGDGMGTGFAAGLATKMRFGRATESSAAGTGFVGVGLELRFKNNVAKTIAYGFDEDFDETENAKLKVSYFDIPIYLHVYPFARMRGMNSLYVEAGLSFGALLNRNPAYLYVPQPSEKYSEVMYFINTDESKLKGGDIHPLIGLGYTIPKTGLDISLRYNIGTTKLASNFTSKMSTLEFSLSYMFKCAKF